MCRLSLTMRRSDTNARFSKTRVIIVLLTVTQVLFTHCVTIHKLGRPDIDATEKIELSPISIEAFLNNVIRISAPIINEQAIYYLYKPNGDAIKLDIGWPKKPKIRNSEYKGELQPIAVKFLNHIKPIISQSNNYDVLSLNKRDSRESPFEREVREMDENDFMIGPLTIEDHGNWVLSVYTKEFYGDWIELFQVITVTITEYVIITPWRPTVTEGDILFISFLYPIPSLESCELIAPRTTFDRLYDRRRIDMNKCGFVIPRITMKDMGEWKIIGVGKIVYEGDVFVTVKTRNTSTTTIFPTNITSTSATKSVLDDSVNSIYKYLFLYVFFIGFTQNVLTHCSLMVLTKDCAF